MGSDEVSGVAEFGAGREAAARDLLNARVRETNPFVGAVLAEVGKVIVGQRAMVERLMIGLLADGHVLLEGVPGLAKTLAVRTLAGTIASRFQRIQFTPDLLPADLIGTMIYNQRSGEFTVQKGPSLPTSCSPTRSIEPPRRFRAPCSSRCRRSRSQSAGTRIHWKNRS